MLDIWRNAGYPLGNHGYDHLNLNRAKTIAAWTADVVAGEPMVAKHMTGRDWHYYRFPNLAAGTGERHIAAADVLKTRRYRVADVSIAFSDWVYTDAYVRCLARGDQTSIAAMKVQYLRGVDDGIAQMKAVSRRVYGRVIPQVLLMHLGGWSAVTLPGVMARLDRAGARYVTLKRAQADAAYAYANKLPGGGSILQRTAKANKLDVSDIVKLKSVIDVKQICR
ncbi:polysaccharide deacetylase [Sphingomonas montana]|uniref:polysaccharide deacetylase n=1 Tax=Sphingomonas montana TaxID=1843236 RepID=UPI00101AD43F|nr:polysaccharide deacetylase [Sphingomonas montana]